MPKKYIVRLSEEERSELKALISKGRQKASKRLHAQILLKADISKNGAGWTDKKISEALEIGISTVERVRQRLVMEGLEAALNPKPRTNIKPRIIDGEVEAHLIALACSDPPQGRSGWTMQLLADRMIELNFVDEVSSETVRRALKKK